MIIMFVTNMRWPRGLWLTLIVLNIKKNMYKYEPVVYYKICIEISMCQLESNFCACYLLMPVSMWFFRHVDGSSQYLFVFLLCDQINVRRVWKRGQALLNWYARKNYSNLDCKKPQNKRYLLLKKIAATPCYKKGHYFSVFCKLKNFSS